MKIAIFSPFSLPELGANSLRIESFKNYFTKKGNNVIVYSPIRQGINKKFITKGYERYEKTTNIFNIVMKENFDVIIGTSPPLTHSFLALLAGKIKGTPTIIDIRDPWTHAYEGLGIYKKTNIKLWIYKAMEFFAYNLSDKIFVVTEGIRKIVEKKTINKSKIITIWNGTDPKIFRQDKQKGLEIKKNLGIKSETSVFIYAGAFEKKDTKPMIENISEILKKQDAVLLMVCPFQKKETENPLKKLSKSLGLGKKIIFVDSSNFGFNELFKYYSAADIGLDPLPNGMGDYCIPVKTYDYFACGIPVIAKGTKDGSLDNLINKNNLGWFCTTWKSFSELAIEAIKNKNTKIGLNARKLAEEKFDRKYSNEKAINIMQNMVKNK